jgi:hypothetical protein
MRRQSEGLSFGAAHSACRDGHGKVWFRAAVTSHDGDTMVYCDVRAFDAADRQLFKT